MGTKGPTLLRDVLVAVQAAVALAMSLAACGEGSSGLDVVEGALARTTPIQGVLDCGGPTFGLPASPPFSGEVVDGAGEKVADLQLGCVYTGGGAIEPGSEPPTRAVFANALPFVTRLEPAGGTKFNIRGSAEPGPLGCTLAAGPERHCMGGARSGIECQSDADCSAGGVGFCERDAHCSVTPPLVRGAIPGVEIPVCLVNIVRDEISGVLDVATGESTSRMPLQTRVYLAACPQCLAGQCDSGENVGGSCSTFEGFTTSVDCPPSTFDYFGGIDLDFTSTNGTSILPGGESGIFCEGQEAPGAFGLNEARSIVQNGSPPGDLRDYQPHEMVSVITGCVPPSRQETINSFGGLPFPLASSTRNTIQLVRAPPSDGPDAAAAADSDLREAAARLGEAFHPRTDTVLDTSAPVEVDSKTPTH